MLDRNKSQLTHQVTRAASAYLEERGFKPVETEVHMPSKEFGWIADLAGVITPTQTELIDLGLLRRSPGWPKWDDPRRDEKREAYKEKHRVWEEEKSQIPSLMTCLVEVKTSRADFRGDLKTKWVSSWPTDLAYVAMPKGMIPAEEWPERWGVLEYADGCIRRTRVPQICPVDRDKHLSVILGIALRRDSHTRNERWRAYAIQEREDDFKLRAAHRVENITRAVVDIVNGGERVGRRIYDTPEKVLGCYGVRQVPDRVLKMLQPLWGLSQKEGAACAAPILE